MKRIAIVVLLGSTLAALAGGTSAQGIDEAGIRLPVASTYSDTHRVASGAAVAAFPGAADEGGIRLPLASTFADQPRAGKSVGVAFPETVDEAGVQLAPMPAWLEASDSSTN